MKRAINFGDTNEVNAFLVAVRDVALDAIAAGRDATRAPKRRMFSRHEARRRILEAERAMLDMLDAATGAAEPERPTES